MGKSDLKNDIDFQVENVLQSDDQILSKIYSNFYIIWFDKNKQESSFYFFSSYHWKNLLNKQNTKNFF